jgi:hypothetical protein
MRYLAIILPAILLTGCSTIDTIVSKPVEIVKAPLVVQQPVPVNQEEIVFYVITRDNYEQKITEIEESNGDSALVATTMNGYRNLSINVAELRRYIEQQKLVIEAYKQYYESAPIAQSVEETND